MEKSLGVSGDVESDSFIAVSTQNIYAVRSIGEKLLNLFIQDFDGNIVGNSTMASNERGGKLVVSQDVIVLPVMQDSGGFETAPI